MPRLMLNDEQWSKMKTIQLEDRVYNKPEHRQTMEGILYRLHVGCQCERSTAPSSYKTYNDLI